MREGTGLERGILQILDTLIAALVIRYRIRIKSFYLLVYMPRGHSPRLSSGQS